MSKRRPIHELLVVVLLALALSVLIAVLPLTIAMLIDRYSPTVDYSISEKLILFLSTASAVLIVWISKLIDALKRRSIQKLIEVALSTLKAVLSTLKAVRSALKTAVLPVLKAVAFSALIAAVLFIISGKLDLSISIGFAVCIAWIISWLGAQGVKKQTENLIEDNKEIKKEMGVLIGKHKELTKMIGVELTALSDKFVSYPKQGRDPETDQSKKGEEPSGEFSPAQALIKAIDAADAWFKRDITIDDVEAWFKRGIAKGMLGRHGEAILDLNKAIGLKPNYTEAWVGRGFAKAKLGRHEDAIADYDEAIRLKPDHAFAWSGRSIAKTKLGHHEDAIKGFDEAIRLCPERAGALAVGRGTAKISLGRYEEAIADYDETVSLQPNFTEAWIARGFAKALLGRYEYALADFDEALRLQPDNAKAWALRSLSKEALGDKKDARAAFDRAVELGYKPPQ